MKSLQIVRKDLLRFLRSPLRTLLLFAVPIVMASIFALVFGGDNSPEVEMTVLLYDEDEGIFSQILQGGMGDQDFSEYLNLVQVGEEGYEMMEKGDATALVHIPAGFTEAYLEGKPAKIKLLKNPSERFLPGVVEEGVGIGSVVLSEASRILRPELQMFEAMINTEDIPSDALVSTLSVHVIQKIRKLERYLFPPVIGFESVTLDSESSDDEDATDFNILGFFLPGISIMGVLFLSQAVAKDILREADGGLLRQLLTAPITALDYVKGKCIAGFFISSVGFLILMLIGTLAGGVRWGPPVAAGLLMVATALGMNGVLLFLMSLVRTERQGDALTTIIIIVWSMVGGSFLPVSQIPSFLQPISKSTLTYWATSGFDQLIRVGGGLTDILPNILVLTAAGLALTALGAWRLHRRIMAGAV